MRGAALASLLFLLLAAGCGGTEGATTTSTARSLAQTAAPSTLRVAVLGELDLPAGAVRSSISRADLVVVARHVRNLDALVRAHPDKHFAIVGRSWTAAPRPNVAGVVFREDEAAYLAGVVAGLVTAEEGGLDPAVAWVGDRRARIVGAYRTGAQTVDPRIRVEAAWTGPVPALCKEQAIDRVERGASVVLADAGICADGALEGARQQNGLGLRLADFERPEVAVAQLVRDAERGLFHGGENLMFGVRSGAVGIARLDSRVSADTADRARQVEQELASGLRSPG